MPKPDPQITLKALADVIEFAEKVGLPHAAAPLKRFHTDLQTAQPTLKVLQYKVKDASDKAYEAIEAHLCDECLEPLPGNEENLETMKALFGDLDALIYPPKFIEKAFPTTGLMGAELVEAKTIRYIGSPDGIKSIFENSVTLVQHYCQLICTGDYTSAYNLTSPDLKEWMEISRFISEYKGVSERYGGAPAQYHIESIGWIFPDLAARTNAELNKIWPKYVPQAVRRANPYGFWVLDKEKQSGCWGSHWITEHEEGYRIAKFDFYTQ